MSHNPKMFHQEYSTKIMHQETLNSEPRTLLHHHLREKKNASTNCVYKMNSKSLKYIGIYGGVWHISYECGIKQADLAHVE